MNDAEHIRQELNDMSPLLAGISNEMMNEIPEGYFNGLSEKIMLTILEEADSIPVAELPFTVPDDYFKVLPQTIFQKIKVGNQGALEINSSDELAEIAPLLASISKTNVYAIDIDYFDIRDWKFISTKKKSSTKIISLPHWTHYLVAASVFAVIAIGAVFYVGNNTLPAANENSFATKLQKLPDSVISNYLDSTTIYSIGVNAPVNQQLDVNSLLYNISDQQIENYLDDTKDISVPAGRNI